MFGIPTWFTSLSFLWPVAAVSAGIIVLTSIGEGFAGKSELDGLHRKPSKKSRRYPTSREVRVAFKMAKGMR